MDVVTVAWHIFNRSHYGDRDTERQRERRKREHIPGCTQYKQQSSVSPLREPTVLCIPVIPFILAHSRMMFVMSFTCCVEHFRRIQWRYILRYSYLNKALIAMPQTTREKWNNIAAHLNFAKKNKLSFEINEL